MRNISIDTFFETRFNIVSAFWSCIYRVMVHRVVSSSQYEKAVKLLKTKRRHNKYRICVFSLCCHLSAASQSLNVLLSCLSSAVKLLKCSVKQPIVALCGKTLQSISTAGYKGFEKKERTQVAIVSNFSGNPLNLTRNFTPNQNPTHIINLCTSKR